MQKMIRVNVGGRSMLVTPQQFSQMQKLKQQYYQQPQQDAINSHPILGVFWGAEGEQELNRQQLNMPSLNTTGLWEWALGIPQQQSQPQQSQRNPRRQSQRNPRRFAARSRYRGGRR